MLSLAAPHDMLSSKAIVAGAWRETALTVRGGDGELAGMSSSPAKVPVGLLVKLGVVAVALGVLAVLALRGVDLRGLVNQAFDSIRSAGPWVYFGSIAVLPAFGFPISLFYFTAGPAFAGWAV